MLDTTSIEKLPVRVNSAFVELKDTFREAKILFLRRAFDNSLLDYTAIAIIKLAREEKYYVLATEMEDDFKSETGRELPPC